LNLFFADHFKEVSLQIDIAEYSSFLNPLYKYFHYIFTYKCISFQLNYITMQEFKALNEKYDIKRKDEMKKATEL